MKEFNTDVENQAITVKNNVDKWIELSHQDKMKIDTIEMANVDTPHVRYYQGSKIRCLTYSLTSAIKYLTTENIM